LYKEISKHNGQFEFANKNTFVKTLPMNLLHLPYQKFTGPPPQGYGQSNAQSPPFSGPPTNNSSPPVNTAPPSAGPGGPAPPPTSQPYPGQPSYNPSSQANPNAG